MSEQAVSEARFMKTLTDFRRSLHDVVYGGLFIRELTRRATTHREDSGVRR